MKLADAIGKKVNHLLILNRAPYRNQGERKKTMVRVRCLYNDCGEEFDARLDNVANGNTKSCGCAPKIYKKPRPSKLLRDAVWKAADKIAKDYP